MQEAIRNYIEEEDKKNMPLEDIDRIIDRIRRYEIKRVRQKQLRQWKKLNK